MTRWDILIDLINTNGYRNIAEIGVHRGKIVRKVLKACELDRYILVDPVKYDTLYRDIDIFPEVDFWFKTSKQAAKLMFNEDFDLVFLDALHDYEHVLEDIRLWQPKIRKGGILCGDNYDQAHCEGVKQAVGEVFGDKVELREIGKKGVKIWVVRV
jgi:hypothetical protein